MKVTYLLTKTWLSVFAFGPMNERGSFRVKTMESTWLLVHKGIILRNKLPSDFRRNDIAVDMTGCGVRHDEDLVCVATTDTRQRVFENISRQKNILGKVSRNY